MARVIAAATLVNGLRMDFTDTYTKLRQTQAQSYVGVMMDLSVRIDNRTKDFAYYEAAPHMQRWVRGNTIPTENFGSVKFPVTAYDWAKRIPWHKHDREDDQTQGLVDAARGCGRSSGLLPERFLADALGGTTLTLPAVPLAPDGASLYSATDGSGGNRFGVSGGNLVTGGGVASVAAVQTDYYKVIRRFLEFQDGKGQPLLDPALIGAGIMIVHSSADLEIMEKAFLQRRQGIVLGTDAGTTPTNIVQDASRNVRLEATPRLATGDWFCTLLNAPTKPLFLATRQELREFTAFEGDNNSDHTRDTGEEYIQWEERSGLGVALPYATIKVNN